MHKKFERIRTKIKGGCQSGRKVVTHNFKSDLPLVLPVYCYMMIIFAVSAIYNVRNGQIGVEITRNSGKNGNVRNVNRIAWRPTGSA